MKPNQIDKKVINDLTLLLIVLTAWNEKIGGEIHARSWKGYDFEVLKNLIKEGYISGSVKSKSVYLTIEGRNQSKKLIEKYLNCHA